MILIGLTPLRSYFSRPGRSFNIAVSQSQDLVLQGAPHGVACPIIPQPYLLPPFYLPAGCWSIGGRTGRDRQMFGRSTIGPRRMGCGLFPSVIIGGSWYGCAVDYH